MQENQSDTAAHTSKGVSFPGKKEILTKKDGITAKKRVGDGVCVAVPWHPEQYVFPEAFTLLTWHYFASFHVPIICRYTAMLDGDWKLIHVSTKCLRGGMQKDKPRLEEECDNT
jgi:hypothetical protein